MADVTLAAVTAASIATPTPAGNDTAYFDSTTKRWASKDDAGLVTNYAPIDAPTFTGVPAAPTAAADTNTTQLATTAFVLGQAATQAELEAGSSTTKFVTAGRAQFHPSSCKAWGKVTVSAGTPTLAVSYNTTSITDTATGELTWTIATDFSTANYAVFCDAELTATTYAVANDRKVKVRNATQAAGTLILDCIDSTAVTNLLADPTAWHFGGFGDQA